MKSCLLAVACCAMMVCVGCTKGGLDAPTGTVSGTVSIQGKPLTEGVVTFFGENNGDTATAEVQSDGSYSLKYGDGFSVPAGDYRVSINSGIGKPTVIDPQELMKRGPQPVLKNPIPEKYRDPKTSSLIAVVKAGSNSGVDFNLK